MDRLKIARYIALGATVFTIIGAVAGGFTGATFGEVMLSIGMIGGLASYIFGGLLTAIKMAGGIAKWGWLVVPFPYDLMTFVAAFFFAIIAFLFLPIIPVNKAYKESR